MKITSDLTRMDKFVKAVNSDWRVRVGIFSDKTQRKEADGMDNAAIGLAHELGSFERHLPIRSWLLMPIRVSQTEIIRDASYSMVQLLALGRIYDVLKRLGFACEAAIEKAFASGGFGMWAPNAPSTIRRKVARILRNHPGAMPEEVTTSPLVDTGQLRRSVASEVVKV